MQTAWAGRNSCDQTVRSSARASPHTRLRVSPPAPPALLLPAAFSNAIAQGLYSISMIDKQGNVIEDPR